MTITASVPLDRIPEWAVLQRRLIDEMERAAEPFLQKYTHPDGRLIWREGIHQSRDGADDFYESFYNWPLLYLLGGSDRMLELGKRQWDATTRLMEEIGHVEREYEVGYDQFHQSESYIYFYLLCMADPDDEVSADRARRFAAFYTGEDPDAPNYDAERNIIRCAHNGSRGPRWLYEENDDPKYGYSPGMAVYGLPYEDVEGVASVEDLKDPEKASGMGRAMKERMRRGDVATNLHVCSLITNAWLLTGDPKYRDWLTNYVDGWIARTEANDGIPPDNVGLDGTVGQYVNGKWYGSMYGWTWPHGFYNIGMALILAGTQCWLMTGDARYLEWPRALLRRITSLGKMADLEALAPTMSLRQHWIGQFAALGDDPVSWVVPYRHADSGWFDWQPMAPAYPAAMWNVTGDDEDLAMLRDLRDRESYDWRTVTGFHAKDDAGHEQPWFAWLEGDNPDYPVEILQASLEQVYKRAEQVRQDETDPRDNHIHWWQQLNPVTTEALIQLTLGAPQMLYNGGLLLAPLRYFDADRRRPGLPPDVAALVDAVTGDRVAVTLVNVSAVEARRLVVQAGTLAEHRFTRVEHDVDGGDYPGPVGDYGAPPADIDRATVDVDDTHFDVTLPPGTRLRLDIGMERCVGTPTYAFPWDR